MATNAKPDLTGGINNRDENNGKHAPPDKQRPTKKPPPPTRPKPSVPQKPTNIPAKPAANKRASLKRQSSGPKPQLPARPPSLKRSTSEKKNDGIDATVNTASVGNDDTKRNNINGPVKVTPPLLRAMTGPVLPKPVINILEKPRSNSVQEKENVAPKPLPRPKVQGKNSPEMSRPVPPPRKKKGSAPGYLVEEECKQDQENKDTLDIGTSTLLAENECTSKESGSKQKGNPVENKLVSFGSADEQKLTLSQITSGTEEVAEARKDLTALEASGATSYADADRVAGDPIPSIDQGKPAPRNPYENVSITEKVGCSFQANAEDSSKATAPGRKDRPMTNPYENVPSPFKSDSRLGAKDSSREKTTLSSLDEAPLSGACPETRVKDGDPENVDGDDDEEEPDYVNANLHSEDAGFGVDKTSTATDIPIADSTVHGFVPLKEQDLQPTAEKNPLNFKYLRIDSEEPISNDLYVEAPRKGSLLSLPSNDVSPHHHRLEALSQEPHYQSPTSSPKAAARRALFGEPSPSNTSPKKIRRPPPQPPHLDNNFNVLRAKVNEPKPQSPLDIAKSGPKELFSGAPDDNIYVVPRTDSHSNSSGGDSESTKSFQSGNSSLPEDFTGHIYKEPSVHSNEFGHVNQNETPETSAPDFEGGAYSVPTPVSDDYIDPDNFRAGSISLPQESNVLTGTSESDSSGSARSSAGLNLANELETSHSDDGYESVDKVAPRRGSFQADSPDYHSGPEYVDMSPTKEDKRSEMGGEYLHPLSLPAQPAHKKIKPVRPAPPAPIRPPPRPDKSPAPPPLPTLAVLDEMTKYDSLDGRYQRIQSLRREMGLPLMVKGSELSDSESESDEELKPKEDEVKKKEEKVDDNKKQSKLYYIANEILTTERTFVNALRLVCGEFAAAVKQMMAKDPSSLPKNAFSQMFDDLELIYDLDQNFLQDLEGRMKDWDSHHKIGDIVKEYSYFLKMYTNYIKGYDKAMTVFQESCQKFPKFSAIVKEYERKPLFLNLKVTSFMLKPIQRIPSYRLLLIDYLKHLPEDSEDHNEINHGLRIVSQVANHINESMKEGDKFQNLLKLQTRIINMKEIVKPGRYLIKEGILNKLSRKEAQERMFFLLTDCLLYCEHAAVSNQYRLRQELPLAGMMLDVPESIDFNKELTIISTKRSFTVVASSKEERDEWVAAIQSAIDDVSRKIGTFTIKREHGERNPPPLGSPMKEIGYIRPPWVPDSRATMCCVCLANFTTYNRRHHCRACGEIVCNSCSSYEAPLPYLEFSAARVCEKCYKLLYETLLVGEETDAGVEPEQKTQTKLKRSKSAMSSKFKVIKRSKKVDRRVRKTLPSKFTEVTAQEQECSISGYLFVVKKKKLKKRWFVLKDNALYSYKAPSDPAANSTLAVLGYTVTISGDFDAGDYVFQLEHSGLKEPYVYKAESQASADMWVNALKKSSQLSDI